MNHFSFPGMEDVGTRLLQSPHALLALDYDGTLTPIVDDPAQALLAPSVRHLLGELAQRDDLHVAIVSGRALVELQEMVGIPGVIHAGNHGMEIEGPRLNYVEPAAQASAKQLGEIAFELTESLCRIPGVVVENKGLTLSIHYRRVAPVEVEAVRQTVLGAVEPVSARFHVTSGAKVYEVRPLVRWDKGTAVNWIVEELGLADVLVTYIGDDATDENAFTALGEDAVTIKVGDGATATAARYRLPGPSEVHGLLRWINELLQTKPHP